MGPLGIVFLSPRFDLLPCVGERGEPVEVEAFIPKLSLEALHIGIFHGFPRSDKGDADTPFVRPRGECP